MILTSQFLTQFTKQWYFNRSNINYTKQITDSISSLAKGNVPEDTHSR